MLALAVPLAAPPAGAAEESTSLDAARHAVEDVAQRYFDALAGARALDEEIVDLEGRLIAAEAEARHTRAVATARAVEIYKGSDGPLVAVLAAHDVLDSARRAQLIDLANADGNAAIEALEGLADDLRARRSALADRQAEQAAALEQLSGEQDALEARLAEAEAAYARAEEARREAEATAASQRSASEEARTAAATAATSPTAAPSTSSTSSSTSSAPAEGGDPGGESPEGTADQPDPVVAPAPPAEGEHPRHGEPFLVCTRQRESGGNYAAVNPAGYYGAYQFSPATWDTTAVHADRPELIGVLPSRASEWDQDDLAWTLYQWQGNRPWGGRC